MKRVLVFGITENPGGVESVIMNYYRRIDRDKIQFEFLCNTKIVAYEEEIKSLRGIIHRIPARRDGRKEFAEALETFMQENAQKYCAIWVNVCSLANIDYLKAAKKFGIPKRIIHCHNADNGDSFLRGQLHKMNRAQINKYATDFWSCSDEASKWFFGEKNMRSEKYKLIYNAVDPDKFLPDADVREKYRKKLNCEDKIVIGHIGRFHFQKNHKFVLEIMRDLVKAEKNVELLLIGQGELMEEMKTKVSDYGLEENVQFLGVRSDIPQLYQAMDLFLFPSVFEGLPIVLLEAQANGLPCVVSDTITKQIQINENLYFKKLTDTSEDWADFILNTALKKGRVTQDKFLKSPYNIKLQTEILEKLLTE